MKAIKITTKNRDILASRYTIEKEEYEDRLPLDFYVVTDFGNEETFDVITQEALDRVFNVGVTLENGWLEIVRK